MIRPKTTSISKRASNNCKKARAKYKILSRKPSYLNKKSSSFNFSSAKDWIPTECSWDGDAFSHISKEKSSRKKKPIKPLFDWDALSKNLKVNDESKPSFGGHLNLNRDNFVNRRIPLKKRKSFWRIKTKEKKLPASKTYEFARKGTWSPTLYEDFRKKIRNLRELRNTSMKNNMRKKYSVYQSRMKRGGVEVNNLYE